MLCIECYFDVCVVLRLVVFCYVVLCGVALRCVVLCVVMCCDVLFFCFFCVVL